tara:strand:- start:177 stop:494 length:318 start_codon:yes stop_codon:yes gene_type:complete
MATLERSITSKESLEFLKSVFQGFEHLGVNLKNHKKTPRTQDTYQITVDKLSDTFITRIKEWSDYEIKDVYYHPLIAPQGYGISLRYRVYIVYGKIKLSPKSKRR